MNSKEVDIIYKEIKLALNPYINEHPFYLGLIKKALIKSKHKINDKNSSTVPEFEDFKEYAYSKCENLDDEKLRLKYDSWIENDWKNGMHKPIKNWKTALLNTIPYLKLATEKSKYPDIYDPYLVKRLTPQENLDYTKHLISKGFKKITTSVGTKMVKE